MGNFTSGNLFFYSIRSKTKLPLYQSIKGFNFKKMERFSFEDRKFKENLIKYSKIRDRVTNIYRQGDDWFHVVLENLY
jgi:hypothetical protein